MRDIIAETAAPLEQWTKIQNAKAATEQQSKMSECTTNCRQKTEKQVIVYIHTAAGNNSKIIFGKLQNSMGECTINSKQTTTRHVFIKVKT